jgi:A/G-specific adenine glycosylase
LEDRKIKFFQLKLLEWFNLNGREFPWREPGLPVYEYIIAEVLLQRTRAETVNRFYQAFLAQYPSWTSISQADVLELENVLKPVGLYKQRAGRLHNLAKEMVKRGEVFPTSRNELELIPFMGQYIANAVEVFAFGKPSPLLDVNMARLLERVFRPRKLADIRYDPYLQKLASKVVHHQCFKELNWAILDHAALICTIKNPKCSDCPLNSACSYYEKLIF